MAEPKCYGWVRMALDGIVYCKLPQGHKSDHFGTDQDGQAVHWGNL